MKNSTSKDNNRRMNAAKTKARQVFESGGSIADCPYKSKSWRSCFAHEMQRLQQQVLM